MLNNYAKAQPYYKEATSYSAQFPLAKYWYAKSLRATSNFDEAQSLFTKFVQEYANDDTYQQDAIKELKNLQFRQFELQKKDLSLYSVGALPVNAAGATSAPAFMNGKLVFSSTRPDSGTGQTNPFINKLYESNLHDSLAIKFSIPQAKDEHLEGATFSADGTRMYVTKWTKQNGKTVAAIYSSTQLNGSWSEPILVTGDINTTGNNSQQPFLTADGKLYYASNKPGGSGGFDIWMTTVDAAGNPGTSVNLGAIVNTKDDEYAPSYFAPANTLLFSSNGRTGMGGFDFFQTKNNRGNLVAT